MSEPTIGRGTFSLVCKALFDNEQVARKTVTRRNQIREMLEEYHILRKLKHPNIVKALGLTPNRNGFFMPLYHSDLSKCLGRELVSQHVDLLVPLCKGLQYLHSKDIVHLDIKPANILLDKSKTTAVFCDFGFATQSTRPDLVEKLIGLPTRSAPKGTLLWMAPERLIHPQLSLKASDIYSMALVCYAIFADEDPWNNYEDEQAFIPELLADRLIKELKQPTCCPTHLWNVLHKAWLHEWQQRPDSSTFSNLVEENIGFLECPNPIKSES